MKGRLIAAVCAAIAVMTSAPAWAQSGSAKADLSGTVVDSGGGVLPGATVDVKNNATGVLSTTVTNTSGTFAVPALDAGTYTVTISMQGFKTSVTTDVQLVTATPRSLKVTLEVGAVSQTVEVKGGAQLVQTQSTTISSTINADKIQNLPLVTRNALNFVVFLPGVDTSTSNHLQRSSTIMGLPQSAISISIDGVNVQDNYTKTTDGFFANIRPQLDMVQEVTVSTATPSADSAGQGAIQIKFVTRSGTNKFDGSAYEYFRNPALNTNNYFNIKNNLPKNDVKLNQFGARAGGPIVIPGLIDLHDRAFYFVNYEEFRLPSTNTRTRTILNPLAQNGLFQYSVAGAVQTVDLLALAAKNGQTSTFDPTVQAVLAEIRNSTGAGGTINQRTDPNLQDYLWQPSASRIEHIPSTRLELHDPAHELDARPLQQQRGAVPRSAEFRLAEDVPQPGVDVAALDAGRARRERGALRLHLVAGLLQRRSHAGRIRGSGRLQPRLPVDQRRHADGGDDDAQLLGAQRQELEPRRHGQLAQGQAHDAVRRVVHQRQRLVDRAERRADDHVRRRPDQRPGQCAVHHGELPGGGQRGPDDRAQPLRVSHGTRDVDRQ
jgi:hypothetical protein